MTKCIDTNDLHESVLHTRYWLKTMLRKSVVEVVFTKKDGTERTMKATLKAEYLPVIQPKSEVLGVTTEEASSPRPRAKSADSIAVWDVEANGWRSFRWDSIKSTHILGTD